MAGYGARNKPSEGAVHDLWAKALVLEDPAGGRPCSSRSTSAGSAATSRTPSATPPRRGSAWSATGSSWPARTPTRGPVVGDNLRPMYPSSTTPSGGGSTSTRRRSIASVDSVVAEAVERPDPGRPRLGDRPGRLRRQPPQQQGDGRPRAPRGARPEGAGRPRRPGAPRAGRRREGPGRSSSATPATARSSTSTSSAATTPASPRSPSRRPTRATRRCSSPAAAADQNPLPRRTVELAEKYGGELAVAVDEVLAAPMHVGRRVARVGVRGDRPPLRRAADGATSSQATAKSKDPIVASRAETLLATLEGEGEPRPDVSLPRPGLAARRPDLGLPGRRGRRRLLAPAQAEPRLVAHLGLGVLQRRDGLHPLAARPQGGRLRGATAMIYYGLPTSWSEEVEEQIVASVTRLVRARGPLSHHATGGISRDSPTMRARVEYATYATANANSDAG